MKEKNHGLGRLPVAPLQPELALQHVLGYVNEHVVMAASRAIPGRGGADGGGGGGGGSGGGGKLRLKAASKTALTVSVRRRRRGQRRRTRRTRSFSGRHPTSAACVGPSISR